MEIDLVIEDEYIKTVGESAVKRGRELDRILEQYIRIMKDIGTEAIAEGRVAQSVSAFTECAASMNGQLREISELIRTVTAGCVQEVSEADSY